MKVSEPKEATPVSALPSMLALPLSSIRSLPSVKAKAVATEHNTTIDIIKIRNFIISSLNLSL